MGDPIATPVKNILKLEMYYQSMIHYSEMLYVRLFLSI